MCSICVSTMSSRCLLYRAPNPNSQSIFNFGSYLMLFVCCYTLLYADTFNMCILFNFFFLPLVTNGIFYWCITFILLLYASQFFLSILFLNFFFIFFLPLATNGIFYWYLTSILLLYSDTFKLSILF